MEIKFLGGAKEVGRVAISVKTNKTQILLDYGVMLNHTPGFPMHISPKEINAIIATHSHLDHTGAIPVFYISEKKPVYGTRPNLEFTDLLIKDFIHLSSYYLPYEYIELNTMVRSYVSINYGEEVKIGDISFRLLNSGHLPGGASVIIEAEGKRLLYTSDFNTVETRLLPKADQNYGELDAVIIESTYATEDHTERNFLEEKFISEVTSVVESGGTVLIPAFSVGRAQEIACILAAHHFEHPTAMDGMAREASRILMNYLEYLKDPRLFMDAMHMVNWVDNWRERKRIAKKPGVIISPAGMLKGGPASYYLQIIGKKSRNAIFLVGYQVPGTPGRELLEKGKCIIDGKVRKVEAKVAFFDFSSHCGAKELKETVRGLRGKPKVFTIHGAEGNCEKFAKWVRDEIGLEAVSPNPGESFLI